MTLIMGQSVATAKQLATYLLSVNKTPKFSRNISAEDFCQLYIDIGKKEGVRGDLGCVQCFKETGNLKYGGDVLYTQNNFAGLGATGNGVRGCVFPDIETGILAHIQHLKSYATKSVLNEPCVNPRRTTWFMNVKGGTSPNVETLGGTWAVPGYNTSKYKSLEEANNAKDSYGYQIVGILNTVLKIKEETSMAYTNSSLVTYTKISPNRTSPRNHKIDTITIHCYVGQVTAQRGCNGSGFVTYNPITGSSCNYVVGYDGSIGLCVPESDRSWCTSNSTNDHRAITIEVACETTHPYTVTDKAMAALINLCADICKRNDIKKLVWSTNKNERVNHLNGCNMTVHRDYKNKACPGQYLYERHGYIANEVNKKLGVVKEDVVVVPSETSTYKVEKYDTLSKIGAKTGIPWKTIANLNGIKFPYTIHEGQVLKLTATSTSQTTTTATNNTSAKYIYNGLNYSLVFDPTYYANKYGDLKKAFGSNTNSLWNHFKTYGLKEGRQGSANFNVIAYKNRYADLQKAFGNNLPEYYKHYVQFGNKEGRSAL